MYKGTYVEETFREYHIGMNYEMKMTANGIFLSLISIGCEGEVPDSIETPLT